MSENAQLRPSYFVRLQENEYPGEAPSNFTEPPECACFYVEGTGGCKADCGNRKLRVQCNAETCPCGENCTNILFRANVKGQVVKPFQRAIRLGVFNHPNKGWALKTLEDVSKGRMLEEVLGEVLTLAECASRLQTPKRRAAAKTSGSHFLISLDREQVGEEMLYLDLTEKSSLSRFANHSSTPNCELQIWNVFGEKRVGLFALKDIKKDSEITLDYGETHVGDKGIENHC
ncbi:hypothetical protein GUITHDRAFT_66832, partial [Guillardia theta CCMP2712]